MIVLENHAYDASFTPLEGTENTYLQNLPQQGALLTNYYGTGHSSLDNYISMVSGQGPQADDQDDCPSYNMMAGSLDTSGSPSTNSDYGQFQSAAGPDAPPNDNGCVYPDSVNTIFNQLNSQNKSWKVYAQDVASTAGASGQGDSQVPTTGQNAGIADCGAPESSVQAAPQGSQETGSGGTFSTNDGSANANSQYVSKHNPLAWFQSLLPASMGGEGQGDCSQNLAPLFGPTDALYQDLQSESTTPAFSYIVPDNCNNGHDAVCKGNNLSGESAGYPTYNTSSTIPAANNYTGGTSAESNFLGVVIPEIEASPAFKDNGMIVVTYDESYPPYTYSSDSQANSQLQAPDAFGSLIGDEAGETLYGRSLNWEPTGPNATIVNDKATGQVLTAGPGDSAYVDRPTSADGGLVACKEPVNDASGSDAWVGFTAPTGNAGTSCVPGFQASNYAWEDAGGVGGQQSASVSVTAATPTSTITDGSANVGLDGAEVTLGTGLSVANDPNSGSDDGNVYVGQVSTSAQDASSNSGAAVTSTGLPLVNSLGNSVTITGTGTATIASKDNSTDPFYDAFDATLGGGDSGAIVISPDIKPGTVSNTYYNHYSLLRTIEDVLVPDATDGVGGSAYLGFAAQPGLAPFGSDVFTNAVTGSSTVTQTTTVTTPAVTTPGVTTPGVTTPGPTTTVTTAKTTTTTTPGATTTVAGPTTTVKTTETYALVPNIVGETEAQAKKDLSKDKLKLGKVTKPKGKVKSGDELVVKAAKPGVAEREKTGSKVAIELQAIAKSK